MAKLILHIGTHKTGTTAIQTFLEANADQLKDHGVLFPVFDVRWPQMVLPSRNGFFLNRMALRKIGAEARARDEGQIARCRQELAQMLGEADAPAVLLSDERIWYSGALHRGYWNAMRACIRELGFDDVEIVLYLRRQDRFVESLWNQFVKATKKTESLAEYMNGSNAKAACDYYAGVKRVESAFGKKRVRVAVYDRGRLLNGDVVDDFCHRVGLPLDGGFAQPDKNRNNERLNNNLVELKRLVNRSPEYQQMNNSFGAAFAHAMLADDWTECTEMLSDEERAAFLERYRRGNKALAKEYFAGSELFPAPKPSEAPVWEPNTEEMLRDAVLVLADALAASEKRIRSLEGRIARLESASEDIGVDGAGR